jgi:hypothetical protein
MTNRQPKFDTLEFIMQYEDGSLTEEETIAGFQHLINTGLAWQLQGSYGRIAAHLIGAGLCHDGSGFPMEASH